jgi:hypothetical protein
MKRRDVTAALAVLALPGLSRAAATEAEAASGVRAALERGAIAAVAQLGRTDGFLGDPKVRIALPQPLEEAARLLRRIGQGKRVDELETAMNRAAEAAVPEAKSVFVSTVKAISIDDALKVVRGGPTSVTDYFAARTREPLALKFLPIVTRATEKVQLAERYNRVAGKAAEMGLLQGDQTNVQRYVTARALDGLFVMIGEEEKRIRANPLAAGSAILKKVFGG